MHQYNWLPRQHIRLVLMSRWYYLASFPGSVRSSLAVQNSRRGPGLIHHVMCAAADVTTILLRMMSLDVLARRFTLKEAPRDHSNGSCTSSANCLSHGI